MLHKSAFIKTRGFTLEGCNFAFMDGHVKWLKPEPIVANYGTTKSLWDLQ